MKTKDLVLKVAGEEFAKYGYDAVSMNDLVKKLDINKATIYYHYKDKKTLYNEVIKNALEKSNNNIKAIFTENKDGFELFRDYVNATILTIKEDPNIVPIALRETANFGANMDETFIPFIEEEITYLEIIIKKLKIKDKYKSMNMYSLYSFIFGTVKTFYAIQMSDLAIGGHDDLKQNSEKSLNHISEFISNIVLDAIVEK